MNKNKFHDDLEIGLKGEQDIISKVQEYLGQEIHKTSDYHNFDFLSANNDTYVEVKTRRIDHDKYSTIFFSKAKLKFILRNPTYNYIFVYNCNDGMYVWKYVAEQLCEGFGGRNDRGIDERKILCKIPTKYLNPL